MNEKWVEETLNGITSGTKPVPVAPHTHEPIIASADTLGSVKVGEGLSITSDGTLNSHGVQRVFTITIDGTLEHGSISISPAVVLKGGSISAIITGDEGYGVDKVYLDDIELEGHPTKVTVSNIEADHTIRATFSLIPVYSASIDMSVADPVSCITFGGAAETMTAVERREWAYSFVNPSVVKADGTINYWLDPTDLDKKLDGTASVLDGTDGDVCASFSPLWWTTSLSGDILTINAASQKFSSAALSAHVFNGTERAYNHMGMFEASTNACVSKWAAGIANNSLKTFRTNTQARNTNTSGEKLLSPMTYLTRTMYQILYLFAYGSLNSQTAVGKGVCDKASGSGTHTEAPVTAMKTCGGHFGTGSTGYTDNGTTPIMALWVANGTGGNIWEFCDGCIYRDGNFSLATDQSDMWNIELGYANRPATWTTFAGLPAGASASYISKFAGASAAPFFPKAASGGDSSKYACDACWSSSGEDKCCVVGAAWYNGAYCGAFALDVTCVVSASGRDIGTRLQILSPV